MKKNVFICIPAKNEANTLPANIESIVRAIAFARDEFDCNYGIYISVNDSTDNTLKVAKHLAKNIKTVPIVVIESAKGVTQAETACINEVKKIDEESVVIFSDADCILSKNLIVLFLKQFYKHPELKVVGAHPVPLSVNKFNLIKRFKSKILNFRAYYPKSQIARIYAPQYHPYADIDPQPVGSEYEKKSKTYFHGRCFAIRDTSVWNMPKWAVQEDTYLDVYVNKKYGPGSIRVLYNANVFFNPITSLRKYIATYARIYKDKEILRKDNTFKKQFEYSGTTLDWEYIKTLNFIDRLCAKIYFYLNKLIYKMFKKGLFVNKSIDQLWDYNKKEAILPVK